MKFSRMFITVGRLALVFLVATMIDNGFSGYITKVRTENETSMAPRKTCAFENDIRAKKILIWITGFWIEIQSNGVFVVKFWTREKTASFQFLCRKGDQVSATLLTESYTSINKNCSGENEMNVGDDIEYWITDNSTVLIQFVDNSNTSCDFFDQISEGRAVTFSLHAYERNLNGLRVESVLIPVLGGQIFVLIAFFGIWKILIRMGFFEKKNQINFFDLKTNPNIADISAGLFPSPSSPILSDASSRTSQISEHPFQSTLERENKTSNLPVTSMPEEKEKKTSNLPVTSIPEDKEKKASNLPMKPMPVDIPKAPSTDDTVHSTDEKKSKPKPPKTLPKPKFRKRLDEALAHPREAIKAMRPPSEKLPPKTVAKKPPKEHLIPGFLVELEQKQKYILRTKIKDNLERDSRIVSTEIEHIEVLNKKCRRSTYIDMSGMQKLKRNPDKSNEESIYENMTAFRRLGQLIGRSETKPEHMCSRILGKEEPHYYEIGSSQCESILGNLKDRNPDRPVIWNMKTHSREFTYITKIDSTEEVNRRKKWKRFRTSKQISSLEPHHISVFFDDRSNTDSIGTGSDFDRLSYISALDGIYRSSTVQNAHFAYVFDSIKESRSSSAQDISEISFDNPPLEHHETCSRRASFSSSDSGLSDDDSKSNDCLVCAYQENVVYVNIAELKTPEASPRAGGFRGRMERGSVKSAASKNEEIRVQVVNSTSQRQKSTIYVE